MSALEDSVNVLSGVPEAAGGVQLILEMLGFCRSSPMAEGFDENPRRLMGNIMPGELGCYN